MPIEIKELIIRATIEQSVDTVKHPPQPASVTVVNNQLLIEQLARELTNLNER